MGIITMGKTKFQTLKGFRDFLPEEAIKREYVIKKIKKVFESFGYDPIETPALEYAEVLLGKYGEETDKLLYTFEDRGGRRVGLRYDQTVPTARFIAENRANIPLPFKRYQIQPTWRQENPQKGRFREFLQVDADIFGLKEGLADAEIISLIYSIYERLGFKEIFIKINDRDVLFSLLKSASIPEKQKFSAVRAIDKLDRVGKNGVSKELKNAGIPNVKAKTLLKKIESLKPTKNLEKLFELLNKMGIPKNTYIFEPALARGLDYYTGTIFEVEIPDYKAGSVLGGGRYDKLLRLFTGVDIPAVGFGLGFDRTIEAMEQFGLLPKIKTATKVLVTIFSDKHLGLSIEVTNLLRKGGINTEMYADENTKLDKQLKYADKKGIPWAVIIGPNEALKGEVVLKNLKTKKQETVPAGTLLTRIR